MEPPYGTCPECGWQGRDWGFKYHSACKQCLRQWGGDDAKKPQHRPPVEPTFEDCGITEAQYQEGRAKLKESSPTRDQFNIYPPGVGRWWILAGLFMVLFFALESAVALLLSLACFVIAQVMNSVIAARAKRDTDAMRNEVLQIIRPYEEAIASYERDLLHYNQMCEQYWKLLRGTKLEGEVAEVYRKAGYQVRTTKATGDEGIDLILERQEWTGLVQCKGHRRPIGVGAARDLYGTLMHNKADRAILVCPAGFTKGVVAFAQGKPMDLISSPELIRMTKAVPVETINV